MTPRHYPRWRGFSPRPPLFAYAVAFLVGLGATVLTPVEGAAVTYYVRQTVGNDTNDGMSAQTAWKTVAHLGEVMRAGDVAYVGPGLYRESITVEYDGTADKPITFIADPQGKRTGDPPGPVMLTGAEPVDASIFEVHAPGVYKASFPAFRVWGVVEMDGLQYRYVAANITPEYHVDKMSEVSVVQKLASSYFYDEKAQMLYIHTSDGKHPREHEIELIRRGNGFTLTRHQYITVIGFTIRHMQDAGISFFRGAAHGEAIDNIVYGSRQGVRVYGATDILVSGNTLFRNENSGVYFAAKSTDGRAIGNTMYENAKGVRWSSESARGVATDNTLFDHRDAGISVETTAEVVLRRNRLMMNKAQINVLESKFDSDDNCFETGDSDRLVADMYFYGRGIHDPRKYKTLAQYRDGMPQLEQTSREGGCGTMPAKLDVRKLHMESTSYAERARQSMRSSGTGANPPAAAK